MEKQNNRKQLNGCDKNFKGNYQRQKGWGQARNGGNKIKENKPRQSITKMQ